MCSPLFDRYFLFYSPDLSRSMWKRAAAAWRRSAPLCGSDTPREGGGSEAEAQSRATDAHASHFQRRPTLSLAPTFCLWSSGNKTSGAGRSRLASRDRSSDSSQDLAVAAPPGRHLTRTAPRIQVISSSVTGDPGRWVQSPRYLS